MLFSKTTLQGKRLSLFILLCLGTILVLFFAQKVLSQKLFDRTIEQTRQQAFFLQTVFDANPDLRNNQEIYAKAAELGTRLTLVRADGEVLQDSSFNSKDTKNLENHKDRLEIILAKQNGVGEATRFSGSLHSETVYVAVRLADGDFLRLGIPISSVKKAVKEHFILLASLTGVVALIIICAFYWYANQLQRDLRRLGRGVNAIAYGNYGHLVSNLGREEFMPLADSINILAKDIQKTLTSLKDKNSQLSTILETVEAGIAVLGARGSLRAWNKAFTAICRDRQIETGQQMIEILPIPALQLAVEEALLSPNANTQPLRLETEDKKQILVHLCKPEHTSAKLTLVVIISDITNIVLLEKAHKDFVANVSHELRTPLTAIKGFSETLTRSQCTLEECKYFGQKILKHSNFLAETVEDLLVLAHVDDTAKNLELVETDVHTSAIMARQLLLGSNNFPETADVARIEITHIEACCPVLANNILLVQALRNLMENASRYSPAEKPVRVSISSQNGQCLISVSDDGLGIPKAEQERIFERFYRVEKLRNSETTGLGLAIAKQIIERFAGKIWVESPSPIAKTTFYISLPCI